MTKFLDDWRVQYTDNLCKKNNQYRKRHRKDEPFLCPECDRVWQHYYPGTSTVDYLVDFPRLGCTDKICLTCKNK